MLICICLFSQTCLRLSIFFCPALIFKLLSLLLYSAPSQLYERPVHGQTEPRILRLVFSFPRVSGLHRVPASEPQRWGRLREGDRGVPPHPPVPPLQPPPELRALQELQPDCTRRQPEPPQHQPLVPQHQGEWLNIVLSASTNDDTVLQSPKFQESKLCSSNMSLRSPVEKRGTVLNTRQKAPLSGVLNRSDLTNLCHFFKISDLCIWRWTSR